MADIYKPWIIELKNRADVIIDLLSYYEDGSEMAKQARIDVERVYERAALNKGELEADNFENIIDRYWQVLTVTRNNHPHIELKREVSIRLEYLDKVYQNQNY